MTINYVRYYAVPPGVASERAHTTLHSLVNPPNENIRDTSIFSLDYSRDGAFSNLKSDPLKGPRRGRSHNSQVTKETR